MKYYMINTYADRDVGSIHRLYNCEELQQMYLHDTPFYVYFIRHITSEQFYYGARYKNSSKKILPENDLWIKYFTSSKKVQNLIKIYGKDDFLVSIIFCSFDEKECFALEQTLIKENIKDPKCLNVHYFDVDNSKKIFSVFGKSLSTKGRPKSESTKAKMRKPKTPAHKKNISVSQKLRGGNGPKLHTQITKSKIADTLKNKPRPKTMCPYCKKIGGSIAMSRWHFDRCKENEKQL